MEAKTLVLGVIGVLIVPCCRQQDSEIVSYLRQAFNVVNLGVLWFLEKRSLRKQP